MARLRENKFEPKTEKARENLDRSRREFVAKGQRRRVLIYINDDGTIDLSKMSDRQRDLLGINPEGTTTKPVPAADAEPVPPVAFPPEMAGMMLGVLISIETAIVAPRMDLDAAAVKRALIPIPPIGEALRESAARVMNKYAGTLGAYADEFALVSLIITWQASAFGELRSLKAEMAKKVDAARPKAPDIHETIEMKPLVMPTPPKAPEPRQGGTKVNGAPEPAAPSAIAEENPFFDSGESVI